MLSGTVVTQQCSPREVGLFARKLNSTSGLSSHTVGLVAVLRAAGVLGCAALQSVRAVRARSESS